MVGFEAAGVCLALPDNFWASFCPVAHPFRCPLHIFATRSNYFCSQLAGIAYRAPDASPACDKAPEDHPDARSTSTPPAHDYVLCLDDDSELPPQAVRNLVRDLERDPEAFMCTGYPFDTPPQAPGSDTVASYAMLAYHLPLSIGFSIAERTSFVWGGCMLFRAATLAPGHASGIVDAWRRGGYSDDLAAAATCTARGLPILCPAHAVFRQPVPGDAALADAWRYLRRQLAVLITYPDRRTRLTHLALAAAHAYWSLALVAPFFALPLRALLAADARERPHGASPVPIGALGVAWIFCWVGLRQMLDATLALCRAGRKQPGAEAVRFCWWRLGLGLLLNNALVPVCLVVTFLRPSIVWAGIRYTIRDGKVALVRHPEEGDGAPAARRAQRERRR